MNKKILIFICFIISFNIHSESNLEIEDDFPLTIAYFGETLTHPGIIIGTDFTLVKNTNHQLFATLNIGTYVHRRNHIPVFVSSELGYRLTFNNGFNIHTLLGVGYFHKFLDAEIYEVNDGVLEKQPNIGRPKFMPSFVLGFGWNLSRKTEIPLDIFLRFQAFGEYPVNSFFLPHFSTQIGFRIFIGALLEKKTNE